MAQRLPMVLPLMLTPATGCARGELEPVRIPSSHGNSIARELRCARNSSTVLRVGIRTNLCDMGLEYSGRAKEESCYSPVFVSGTHQSRPGLLYFLSS